MKIVSTTKRQIAFAVISILFTFTVAADLHMHQNFATQGCGFCEFGTNQWCRQASFDWAEGQGLPASECGSDFLICHFFFPPRPSLPGHDPAHR